MKFTNALVGTAVIVGVMSAVSLVARAQNVQSTATVSVTPAIAQESSGGMRDGFKVHGHWTIDVRNPNGSLASHREFENSLVGGSATSGAGVLAKLLTTPTTSIATALPFGLDWAVFLNLNGAEGAATCKGTDNSGNIIAVDCIISMLRWPNGVNSGPNDNLTASIDGTVMNGLSTLDRVKLAGSITAGVDGPISAVFTRLGGTTSRFSESFLNPPINVLANQVIQVTVVFSFS
jgi:hypothetical protein